MFERLILVVAATALYGAHLLLESYGLGRLSGFLVALYVAWSANEILGARRSAVAALAQSEQNARSLENV